MPTQTRSSGRFSRPGTTTQNRSTGRFGRATGHGARTTRTGGRVSRPVPNIGRRRSQPKQSTPQKAIKAIGGLLPTAAAGKASKKTAKAGKKPLGLALIAGAGALAFSQRDKLQAKLGGGDSHDDAQPIGTTSTTGQDAAGVMPATAPVTPPTAPPTQTTDL
jgi:hypothetical protein